MQIDSIQRKALSRIRTIIKQVEQDGFIYELSMPEPRPRDCILSCCSSVDALKRVLLLDFDISDQLDYPTKQKTISTYDSIIDLFWHSDGFHGLHEAYHLITSVSSSEKEFALYQYQNI